MIAGARGDHAFAAFFIGQRRHQVYATANLERTGRVVVLVLDPYVAAAALSQQRPAQQWAALHVGINDTAGRLQLRQGGGKHGHLLAVPLVHEARRACPLRVKSTS